MRRLRAILFGLLAVGISLGAGLVALAVVFNLFVATKVLPDGDYDLWSLNRPITYTILDRTGEELGRRGVHYAEPVPLNEMPPYLIDAFLATEDRRFFRHMGLDVRGLTRAAVTNLKAGRIVEGGSTITQQLAKNLFLDGQKTYSRKLAEAQLSLWLEAHLSKEEILSLYLNRIYLGGGAYGVEAASQTFFGKSARDVTLPEAALLAGLPKAPSDLSPTASPEAAIARSHEVIDNLVEAGKLSAEEAADLKTQEIALDIAVQDPGYGHFLDHVVAEVKDRIGEPDEDVVVTTTLDPRLQAAAERAVKAHINDSARSRGAEEAALLALTGEGEIIAMVGGTDYARSAFNRTTQARRQPGSSFKPFVFLAAIEKGFTGNTVVVDRPVKVGKWTPGNYNGTYRGAMRLRDAAAHSTNTVAVQLAQAVGLENVIDAARRTGITAEMEAFPSLALGAMAVPLIELAGAYNVFAQEGLETPTHSLLKVETKRGQELYTYRDIPDYRRIDRDDAHAVTRLLEGVMTGGTGRGGQLEGRETAGKTGTTNSWKDAWFVGFTNQITAGVWVGNDESRDMARVSGATIPLSIWHDFMTVAHEDLPIEPLRDGTDPAEISLGRLAGFYSSLNDELWAVRAPAATATTATTAGDLNERQLEEAEPERWFGFGPFRRRVPDRPDTGGPDIIEARRAAAARTAEREAAEIERAREIQTRQDRARAEAQEAYRSATSAARYGQPERQAATPTPAPEPAPVLRRPPSMQSGGSRTYPGARPEVRGSAATVRYGTAPQNPPPSTSRQAPPVRGVPVYREGTEPE